MRLRGCIAGCGPLFGSQSESSQSAAASIPSVRTTTAVTPLRASRCGVLQVWEGKGVVATARKIIGATNPLTAEPGTIRGDFAIEVGRNVVHGSDSPENGERETGGWLTIARQRACCSRLLCLRSLY